MITFSYMSHDGYRATSDQHIKHKEANAVLSWDDLKDWIKHQYTVYTRAALDDHNRVLNYVLTRYRAEVDPNGKARDKPFKKWLTNTYKDQSNVIIRATPPKHRGHCILGFEVKDQPELAQSKRILRQGVNVEKHTMLIVDVDGEGTLKEWFVMLKYHNLKHFIYTTSSHCEERQCFRVLIPLKTPVNGDDYTNRKANIYKHFRNKCDDSSINRCRYFYLPTRCEDQETLYFEGDGNDFDLLRIELDEEAKTEAQIADMQRKANNSVINTDENLLVIKSAATNKYLTNRERCDLIWALQGVGFSEFDARSVDTCLQKGDTKFADIWGRYKTVRLGKTRIEEVLNIKLATRERRVKFKALSMQELMQW